MVAINAFQVATVVIFREEAFDVLMNTMPLILISRFIFRLRQLRRNDLDSPCASPSLTASRFRIKSIALGNITEDLDFEQSYDAQNGVDDDDTTIEISDEVHDVEYGTLDT
ncbi:hypothetical protein PsYK624_014050 [Phanerochaete sordida]|uniref:Uncharacterized protein n=1 Tax=Phanerochaete sordida TaxID=48140 RepID=A0A9P3FZ82_9APHY|nr:hypothetical protein PsYK624_014050 [Phanerochaete sordida]